LKSSNSLKALKGGTMKNMLIFASLITVLLAASMAFPEEELEVGGYEQHPPGPLTEEQIGAGWGHRSMTFGGYDQSSGRHNSHGQDNATD
jgi:hypothetical protein